MLKHALLSKEVSVTRNRSINYNESAFRESSHLMIS